MKKIIFFTFLTTSLIATAQIKLGDNSATITDSAMLEIESTTKGLLIPRMTSTQISSITTLTTGLMVYNTTLNCFSFYNGTAWSCIGSSSTTSSFTSGSVLFSNGTAIAQNNSNLFWDNTNLRLGIGTSAPTTKLNIKGTGSAIPATSGSTQSAGQFIRMGDNRDLVLDFGGNNTGGAWLQSTNVTNLATNYPLLLNPNGGNVCIGTTDIFSERLQVNGNISMGRYLDNFGSRFIGINNAVGNKVAGMEIESTTQYGNYSQKLHFLTNQVNNGYGRRLTIDHDGLVGIGTTNPVAKLTIEGIGTAFPTTTGTGQSAGLFTRMSDSSNLVLDFGGNSTAGAWLQSTDATNLATNYPLLLNPNGGNVGIGQTNNIYEKLQVNGNIGLGHWTDNFGSRFIGISDGSTRTAGMEIENTTLGGNFSQKLHFITHHINGNVGKRLTILEDGNVGIGTTTPKTQLSIKGTGYQFPATSGSTQSVGHVVRMSDGSGLVCDFGGNASSGFWIQSTDAGNLAVTNPLLINPVGGYVGIGTQTPRQPLEVNGGIQALYYNVTSDKRFKKDILPLKNSLEKILQLNGVTYNWDTANWKDRKFDNSNHIGFIAQEVEKIVPTAVNTASDEMKSKSIVYNEFVPLLVESVKELKKEIEELKAEIKSLKK